MTHGSTKNICDHTNRPIIFKYKQSKAKQTKKQQHVIESYASTIPHQVGKFARIHGRRFRKISRIGLAKLKIPCWFSQAKNSLEKNLTGVFNAGSAIAVPC